MKAHLLFPLVLALVSVGCERTDPTVVAASEERARAEAKVARLARERADLAAERERLQAERAQLSDEQQRAADERLAEIRERERLADQRTKEATLAAQRSRQGTQAVAVQTAQRRETGEETLDYFYDALQPHGDWLEVERYGFCWQPRVAERPDWRPYLDGRWTYTNYGWTWISNEPFGWATYHYGRWTRLRRLGWLWVPGSEWAPAWVSWRRGDRYVGWAPLPPEAHSGSGFSAAVDRYYDIGPGQYNFVEARVLDEPTYVGRIVEPERNVTIVRETRNVTNIAYRTVENRTVIINEGPEFEDLSRHARIRRMRIERVAEARTPSVQTGDVIRLLAPFIASAARPQGEPPRVRERVRSAEFERGWGATNAEAAQAARQQLEEEARRSEEVQRSAVRAPATPRVDRAQELPRPLPAAQPPATATATPAPALSGTSARGVEPATPPRATPAARDVDPAARTTPRPATTPSTSTAAPLVTTPPPATERDEKPGAKTSTPAPPDRTTRERRPRSEKPPTTPAIRTTPPPTTPGATPAVEPSQPRGEVSPPSRTEDKGRRRPRNRLPGDRPGATATPPPPSEAPESAPSTPSAKERPGRPDPSDRPERTKRSDRPETSARPGTPDATSTRAPATSAEPTTPPERPKSPKSPDREAAEPKSDAPTSPRPKATPDPEPKPKRDKPE